MSDTVQIWQIQLSAPQDILEGYLTCLSQDEKSRANRFRFAEDRRRFIVSRGALRHILARQLHQSPERISFCYSEYGKPFIEALPDTQRSSLLQPGGDFHFNLTHSGELALCALGYRRTVGIDIESIRPLKRLENLMDRCLSDQEQEQVKAQSADDQPRAFLQTWTCKEAYLKAIGLGLTQSMRTVEVQLTPPRLLHVPHSCSDGWCLHTLALPEGYVGTLVVAGHAKVVQITYSK